MKGMHVKFQYFVRFEWSLSVKKSTFEVKICIDCLRISCMHACSSPPHFIIKIQPDSDQLNGIRSSSSYSSFSIRDALIRSWSCSRIKRNNRSHDFFLCSLQSDFLIFFPFLHSEHFALCTCSRSISTVIQRGVGLWLLKKAAAPGVPRRSPIQVQY